MQWYIYIKECIGNSEKRSSSLWCLAARAAGDQAFRAPMLLLPLENAILHYSTDGQSVIEMVDRMWRRRRKRRQRRRRNKRNRLHTREKRLQDLLAAAAAVSGGGSNKRAPSLITVKDFYYDCGGVAAIVRVSHSATPRKNFRRVQTMRQVFLAAFSGDDRQQFGSSAVLLPLLPYLCLIHF